MGKADKKRLGRRAKLQAKFDKRISKLHREIVRFLHWSGADGDGRRKICFGYITNRMTLSVTANELHHAGRLLMQSLGQHEKCENEKHDARCAQVTQDDADRNYRELDDKTNGHALETISAGGFSIADGGIVEDEIEQRANAEMDANSVACMLSHPDRDESEEKQEIIEEAMGAISGETQRGYIHGSSRP